MQEIGKPGFRFKTDFERPAEKVIAPYRDLMNRTGCLTGNVGDCIGRAAAMDARVKSLAAGMKIVGPALTVRVPPTDNLMIHKALTLIKPGDVLVIEGGGNHSWALLGFLMGGPGGARGATSLRAGLGQAFEARGTLLVPGAGTARPVGELVVRRCRRRDAHDRRVRARPDLVHLSDRDRST